MKEPEIVASWKRKIWNTDFLDYDNPPTFLRKDWDNLIVDEKTQPEAIFVMFELTGVKTSHEMAVWTDDNIFGLFLYRDWTKSSLPFVDENEVYWSGFTFQKLEDAKFFAEKFNGIGNWMKEYKEFEKECSRKRNER